MRKKMWSINTDIHLKMKYCSISRESPA